MEDRLKLYCLMGSLWGNFLLKLCSAISSISVWTLAMSHVFRFFTENYHAGASGGHRHFHGITEAQWSHWATLSWRLSICHCSQPQPLALFSSLSFSVMRLVREECGGTVAWHSRSSHTETNQIRTRRKGKEWEKGVVVSETTVFGSQDVNVTTMVQIRQGSGQCVWFQLQLLFIRGTWTHIVPHLISEIWRFFMVFTLTGRNVRPFLQCFCIAQSKSHTS